MLFLLWETVQGMIVNEIRFPINPERVQVATASKMQTFSPIELGDIVLPRGNAPYRVNFDGIFPGTAARLPLNADWIDPLDAIITLDNWVHPEHLHRPRGLLHFRVTDSPIDVDVYLDNFNYTIEGGFGDIGFQITLIEARPLFIYEMGAAPDTSGTTGINGNAGGDVPSEGTPPTHYTGDGDSLYEIAKIDLGDMERVQEIIDLNSDKDYPDGLRNPADGTQLDIENLPGGITLQLPQ